jgi:hypothetical protein
LENEEELFIDRPISEKDVKKELIKGLEELVSLREKDEELEQEKS